jgi:Fe-S oxidoreductase
VSGVPTTENCRFCWMCRHVCPVGVVTHRETYTPHAWALTVESVKRGQLIWNAETALTLYACADCGLCETSCVTDQPLPNAIAAARADVIEAGAAPPVVAELDARLRAQGHPYAGAAPPRATATGPLALFVGDAAYHLAPGALENVYRLLAAAGVPVVPVGVGRSSGWLASSLGLRSTAVDLAEATLDEVRATGAAEVLTISTADRWAFARVYAERLDLAWPEGVRVREATDVLAEAAASSRLQFRTEKSAPYAYHDPCHAPRIGRAGVAPRALLVAAFGTTSAVDVKELFWREARAHPCGAIGGLEFTHPPIAGKLAQARLADATAAGADVLVTDDLGCFHHLGGASRNGPDVRNLFDLLAARSVR